MSGLEIDNIIFMARKAGFDLTMFEFSLGFVTHGTHEEFERFAALVAAAEREACAKLIEPTEEHRRDASWGFIGGDEGVVILDGAATSIRARGQQENG
jgi:hypothetical protein